MGMDAADVDGDGWLDIYVTHLDFELNRLYHNNHDESFDDATFSSGLGNKAILLSGVSAEVSITTTMAGSIFSRRTARCWTTSTCITPKFPGKSPS